MGSRQTSKQEMICRIGLSKTNLQKHLKKAKA